MSQLDEPSGPKPAASLNASGIDNALDALSLTGSADAGKVDKHPERRYAAALKKYEQDRLPELGSETGLRRDQKMKQIKKEFERHPDNPFNQVTASYDSTRDEVREIKEQERAKIEARLGR